MKEGEEWVKNASTAGLGVEDVEVNGAMEGGRGHDPPAVAG